MANKSFAKISPINARYVMTIDDDDMLIDPNFVIIFREIIDKSNPEIVFLKLILAIISIPGLAFGEKLLFARE